MSEVSAHTLADRVRAHADDAARGTELFVVDVLVRGPKGNQIVDVFVDTDEGVGVDDLARYSRELGFLLDTHDVLPGRYHLNASSPGATRPLVLPRQYARHVGRGLKVRQRAPEPGAPDLKLTGTLVGIDGGGFRLAVDGQGEQHVAFDDVVEAVVQLPW